MHEPSWCASITDNDPDSDLAAELFPLCESCLATGDASNAAMRKFAKTKGLRLQSMVGVSPEQYKAMVSKFNDNETEH